MSNNLPKEYNKNIFSIFIWKIINFFIKTDKDTKTSANASTMNNKQINKKDLIDSIKMDINFSNNTELEKRTFMDNLSNNPSLLENFSVERLEKILQLYLDENRKKTEILRKIEQNN